MGKWTPYIWSYWPLVARGYRTHENGFRKRNKNGERAENSFSLSFHISNPCLGLYNFCLLFFTLNAVAVCLFYFVCLLVLAGLCQRNDFNCGCNAIGSEVFWNIDLWFIYLRTFQFIQSDCDLIWKKHLIRNSKIKWFNSTKNPFSFKNQNKSVKEFGSEQQVKCFFRILFLCVHLHFIGSIQFFYWHKGLDKGLRLDISFQYQFCMRKRI